MISISTFAQKSAARDGPAFSLNGLSTNFTSFTKWCYDGNMKRATMTLPDDLAEAMETYQNAQEAPPSLTTVVQAALRQYLGERGFLRTRRPLQITPALKGSGRSDVSQQHDRYFAEAAPRSTKDRSIE